MSTMNLYPKSVLQLEKLRVVNLIIILVPFVLDNFFWELLLKMSEYLKMCLSESGISILVG